MSRKANQQAASENNSGSFVTVGCKLPHGRVIHLAPEEKGGPITQEIELNGMNATKIVGGYGLTQVPTEFWEIWCKENPRDIQVKNGLIFAHENKDYVEAEMISRADVKNGLEALDPNAPGKDLQAENFEGMKKRMS